MHKIITVLGLLIICASAATAQNLSLKQLIAIRQTESLSEIDNYLSQLGWRFDKADPAQRFDQVVYVHPLKDEANIFDATLNIILCNEPIGEACDKKWLHADSALRLQHPITLIYQLPKASFYNLKRNAEEINMQVSTVLYERGLRTIYTGHTYKLELSQSTSDDGTVRYFADLVHK